MSEIESKIQEKKIACIGCGVMGGSLVKAMTKVVNAANITVTAANYTEAVDFATAVGVKAAYGNAEAVKDADFVFLAVKPAYIGGVLGEIKDSLKSDCVLVSMAAGVKTETIATVVGERKIVRIMPNIPATVGEGMIALCKTESATKEDAEAVKELLSAAGRVDEVGENQVLRMRFCLSRRWRTRRCVSAFREKVRMCMPLKRSRARRRCSWKMGGASAS